MRKRKIKGVILACCLLGLVAFLFAAFSRELVPSLLTVHAPKTGWHSFSLDGNVISNPTATFRVSPIDYGPHLLRIKLTNGKSVWATFYHYDTGEDRQLNIYIEYDPRTDTATFRQTITRFNSLSGKTYTAFTGSVKPEATSQTKPFMLDYI